MLRLAAWLRALAGALAWALILAVALAHQARADDAPQDRRSVAAASSPQPVARSARSTARVAHLGRGVKGAGRPAGHPLVSAALRDLGRGKFTRAPGPWCADGLNAWLRRAGYSPLASRKARDFAGYGRPTAPRPGAIVVSRHHVGIVVAVHRGRVTMVSGNWGGRVRIGRPSGVIAYRAPV